MFNKILIKMDSKYNLYFRLTDPDDWYLVKFNNHTVFEGPLDDCMTFIKSHSKGV